MSSQRKLYTRPHRTFYDTVTRWLTPTGFAWFLAGLLSVMLLVLAIKGAHKLSDDAPPYRLLAMSGATLDMTLRDMETAYAVVLLYDAACHDCEKQIDTLLNLRSLTQKKELGIYIISLDATPETAVEYLKAIGMPESMATYYAGEAARAELGKTLERIGSAHVDFQYPHTLLIGKGRKFIIEYKGYVRSQEILRTIKLNNLMKS